MWYRFAIFKSTSCFLPFPLVLCPSLSYIQRLIWSILEFLKNNSIPRVRGPDGFPPNVPCPSMHEPFPRKPKKLFYSTISLLATTFKIKSQLSHCKRKFCPKVKWNKHIYNKRLYYLDLSQHNTASQRPIQRISSQWTCLPPSPWSPPPPPPSPHSLEAPWACHTWLSGSTRKPTHSTPKSDQWQ